MSILLYRIVRISADRTTSWSYHRPALFVRSSPGHDTRRDRTQGYSACRNSCSETFSILRAAFRICHVSGQDPPERRPPKQSCSSTRQVNNQLPNGYWRGSAVCAEADMVEARRYLVSYMLRDRGGEHHDYPSVRGSVG